MRRKESELWRAFREVADRHPRKPLVLAADGAGAWRGRDLVADALALAAEADLARASGGCVAFSRPTSSGWFEAFLALQSCGVAAMAVDPGSFVDWTDAAARAGATHALIGRELTPLAAADSQVDWRRFVCAKLTSGSTGAPNVVPCRANHLLADGENIVRTMGIRPTDRNLALLPLGHSYGLGNLVMPLILQGTSVVTAPEFLPRQVLDWIAVHRVTVLPSVPVVLKILAELPGGTPLPTLRLVISAGAPLPPSTAQRFFSRFGRYVHNFYGSSETGGICYDQTGAASLSGRSVGRPLAGVSVDVARGGRIVVRGAAVAMPRGRHALTDIGEWTGDGEVRILGRSTEVANIGGRKVSTAEVEGALLTVPDVSAAWVTVVEEAGRDLLAAVVESPREASEILGGLAGRLVAWKQPRRLVSLRELPRNARGKLEATVLRVLLDQGRSTGTK